mmetsp:Transcript_47738/g.139178  ORF Transcript_47738/g.139178 Transcript_47738/m.139178 type:complete len:231 (-) Transcript_47738:684-1376(-)
MGHDRLEPRLALLQSSLRHELCEVLPDDDDTGCVRAQLHNEADQDGDRQRGIPIRLSGARDGQGQLDAAGAEARPALLQGVLDTRLARRVDQVLEQLPDGAMLRDACRVGEVLIPACDEAVAVHGQHEGVGLPDEARGVLFRARHLPVQCALQQDEILPIPEHDQARRLPSLQHDVAVRKEHVLLIRREEVGEGSDVHEAVGETEQVLAHHDGELERVVRGGVPQALHEL